MKVSLDTEENNSQSVELLKPPFIIGLSITGLSHNKIGLPCQDACKYEMINPNFSVIALSDGLGSAKHSELGSKIAVDSIIYFCKNLNETILMDLDCLHAELKNSVEYARNEIEKFAEENKIEIHELACTLIIILVLERKAIVAQIGDGAVVGKTPNGFELLSFPEDQEYVNEVVPITCHSWETSLKISTLFLDVEYIIAFTDGCQRAILTKKEGVWSPNSEFLDAFFSYLFKLKIKSDGEEFLKEIIESKKFSEISDDDKTLIVGNFEG